MMAYGSMIQLISKNIIKPFSETSSSLKLFKLSLFDQMLPNVYVPTSFLFLHQNSGQLISRAQNSLKLQDSLSRTLSYYFPFAGRLKDEKFVNCNDDGVLFLEVDVKKPMNQVKYPDTEDLDLVFPKGLPWRKYLEGFLAVFQLSYFECGGMAISACISHRLADAATVTTFINDWALMAREPGYVPSPHFIGESPFKPLNNSDNQHQLPPKLVDFQEEIPVPYVTRTYVFDGPGIAKLKSIAAKSSNPVEKPTRVEVVVAFLLNRLMSVVKTRRKDRSFRPSVLYQFLNLRQLVRPPMPANSVGNFVTRFGTYVLNENEMEFAELVGKIRAEKVKHKNDYKVEHEKAKDLALAEAATDFKDFDVYFCSSWSGFPLYQADFGWGRPTKVCGAANLPFIDGIVLTDTPSGDGIQATVALEEQVMSMFECDEELLQFAFSTNPISEY